MRHAIIASAIALSLLSGCAGRGPATETVAMGTIAVVGAGVLTAAGSPCAGVKLLADSGLSMAGAEGLIPDTRKPHPGYEAIMENLALARVRNETEGREMVLAARRKSEEQAAQMVAMLEKAEARDRLAAARKTPPKAPVAGDSVSAIADTLENIRN